MVPEVDQSAGSLQHRFPYGGHTPFGVGDESGVIRPRLVGEILFEFRGGGWHQGQFNVRSRWCSCYGWGLSERGGRESDDRDQGDQPDKSVRFGYLRISQKPSFADDQP